MSKVAFTVDYFTGDFDDLLSPLTDAGIEYAYVPLMSTVDQTRVGDALAGYDYVLAASEIYGGQSVPALADTLKLIARNGVGVESVDIPLCSKHNIAVANMPGSNAAGVAEYAVCGLLALLRGLCPTNAAMHAGHWTGQRGFSLEGTLGLLGFGAIARKTAQFASGFPLRIIAFDPYGDPEAARRLNVELVDLDCLVANSDFISIHTPLNDMTRRMVDGALLSRMKKGVYIVNTSRGPVVDEGALIEALRSGQVAGAVLDVFEHEPTEPDNPLLSMDNVILSPHFATASLSTSRNVLRACVDTILKYHAKEMPANVINRDAVTLR